MKKLILLLSTVLLFVSISAFAQNTFQKAKDTNAAGRSAVQSQSDTDARNIGNQAWDGSAKGSGTPSEYNGKTIDLIGGNKNIDQKKDEKPSFDKNIVPADVTPWKNEFKAMFGAFAASLALVFIAGMTAFTYPTLEKIALGMAITAAAGLLAALSLAVVIMTKYSQTALGGMWVGLISAAIALCAVVIYACTDSLLNEVWASKFTHYISLITFLASAGLGLGTVFTLSNSNKINKKYQQDQICPTNPEHEVCSNDEFSTETGNLL